MADTATVDDETQTGPEEGTEGPESPDDLPSIDNDEAADLSAVADDIQAAAAEAREEDAEQADEAEDDAPEAPAEGGAEAPGEGRAGRSADWGDMYVRSLTTGLNTVIDARGSQDADHIGEEMARDLNLDAAVDDIMAKRGRADMPPEQEVAIGTLVLVATVLLTHTDLAAEVLEQ